MRSFVKSLLAAALTAAVLIPAAAVAETVVPDWVKKPTSDDLDAAWPASAKARGISGKATLICEVNLTGGLEKCRADSETPAGEGFGAAALMLVPSFLMTPRVENGKPVRGQVRIPIAFTNQGAGGGDTGRKVTLMTNPSWKTAPSFEEMAQAWPTRAADVQTAHVSMRCRLTDAGVLRNCEILTENPRAEGFGAAARKLSARFSLDMALLPSTKQDQYVNLALRFTHPDSAQAMTRAISRPRWVRGPDPKKVLEIFPDAAVKAGVTSGTGVADCMVQADGSLADCKVSREEPAGLGFGEAAVVVAQVMQMAPWTEDGGPVDGARIKLPVKFKKAPDEPATAPAN